MCVLDDDLDYRGDNLIVFPDVDYRETWLVFVSFVGALKLFN